VYVRMFSKKVNKQSTKVSLPEGNKQFLQAFRQADCDGRILTVPSLAHLRISPKIIFDRKGDTIKQMEHYSRAMLKQANGSYHGTVWITTKLSFTIIERDNNKRNTCHHKYHVFSSINYLQATIPITVGFFFWKLIRLDTIYQTKALIETAIQELMPNFHIEPLYCPVVQ
jgi:hypothetical protein